MRPAEGTRKNGVYGALTKLHGLNPQAYLLHVLEHLATAKTLEQLEQLLAWNVKLETPAQIRTTQPS